MTARLPDIGERLDTVRLAVYRVRSYHPRRGVIFSGHDESGKLQVIRAHALSCEIGRPPAKGEIWEITGRWEHHPEYGWQLEAQTCRLAVPTDNKLLIRYIEGLIEGVGAESARKVVAYFDQRGENLAVILNEGRIDRLYEVLSDTKAEKLLAGWQDYQATFNVVAELARLGFNTRLGSMLLRLWGDYTLDVIEANPYFMLAFASWEKVDAIARKMGIDGADERRLVGAVEAALYRRLDAKHTLTSHVQLRTEVQRLLGHGHGRATAEKAIDLALACAIEGSREAGYQTRPVAHMESYLKDRIHSMMAGEKTGQETWLDTSGAPKGEGWRALVDPDGALTAVGCERLNQMVAEYERAHKVTLNQAQREAILLAVEQPFAVIKGGAGTGKTSVIQAIQEVTASIGVGSYQMALAGRAAERMRLAGGRDAYTIAKFLAMVRGDEIQIQPGDLVIVDESSMLDVSTLYMLLKRVPQGARMLLVGDPGQLPPIGFGLTYHVLADDESCVPKVELTEIHRQAAATGIPLIARDIRNNTVPALGPYVGKHDGVSFIECEMHEIVDVLLDVSQTLGGPGETQIVSAIKSGVAGTLKANSVFHEARATGKKRFPGEEYAVGDPVSGWKTMHAGAFTMAPWALLWMCWTPMEITHCYVISKRSGMWCRQGSCTGCRWLTQLRATRSRAASFPVSSSRL